MWRTPSLPLFSDYLRPRVVVPIRVSSKIDLDKSQLTAVFVQISISGYTYLTDRDIELCHFVFLPVTVIFFFFDNQSICIPVPLA